MLARIIQERDLERRRRSSAENIIISNLHKEYLGNREHFMLLKETVDVIPSDPSIRERHVRLTTVTYKALSGNHP